jgi:PAS domain S-box-containing protein
MNDTDDRPDRADELRQRAEARVREGAVRTPKDVEALSPTQTWRLLHDLQVHQIELEMQNEELRRTQVELDAARERYFGLYDLAPVGYCTVSESGLTLEANLTAARLLGVTRRAMVRQPFSRFILDGDRDVYYLHRKQLFATGEPQAWQVRMVRGGGAAFWAHLEATVAPDTDGGRICRVVVSDITERQQAEEKIKDQLDELQRWQNVMQVREDRVQELKREVNELCRSKGEPIRYPSQEAGPPESGEPDP